MKIKLGEKLIICSSKAQDVSRWTFIRNFTQLRNVFELDRPEGWREGNKSGKDEEQVALRQGEMELGGVAIFKTALATHTCFTTLVSRTSNKVNNIPATAAV